MHVHSIVGLCVQIIRNPIAEITAKNSGSEEWNFSTPLFLIPDATSPYNSQSPAGYSEAYCASICMYRLSPERQRDLVFQLPPEPPPPPFRQYTMSTAMMVAGSTFPSFTSISGICLFPLNMTNGSALSANVTTADTAIPINIYFVFMLFPCSSYTS